MHICGLCVLADALCDFDSFDSFGDAGHRGMDRDRERSRERSREREREVRREDAGGSWGSVARSSSFAPAPASAPVAAPAPRTPTERLQAIVRLQQASGSWVPSDALASLLTMGTWAGSSLPAYDSMCRKGLPLQETREGSTYLSSTSRGVPCCIVTVGKGEWPTPGPRLCVAIYYSFCCLA
jgi:hypothetical protein